ncbi:hypothetical protein [Leptolyngbya sp. Heron Island J]|uniref:hypothetical protein n=1 Tax=Leptolyngbya sp. Heron Island J TaxID=1385935 RepID=UPI00126805A9|nr:hypothetical protein [Leptolyngbya sp. Heron Island J]
MTTSKWTSDKDWLCSDHRDRLQKLPCEPVWKTLKALGWQWTGRCHMDGAGTPILTYEGLGVEVSFPASMDKDSSALRPDCLFEVCKHLDQSPESIITTLETLCYSKHW